MPKTATRTTGDRYAASVRDRNPHTRGLTAITLTTETRELRGTPEHGPALVELLTTPLQHDDPRVVEWALGIIADEAITNPKPNKALLQDLLTTPMASENLQVREYAHALHSRLNRTKK